MTSKKVKELSVIDGRRAQNCNILLSRSVRNIDRSKVTDRHVVSERTDVLCPSG